MKTLVIHPADRSTDFLKEIYRDKGFTVISDWKTMSKKSIIRAIRSHDRIMMMGHGYPYGLLGMTEIFMDIKFRRILRTKDCVCIWCNADKYVEREGIRGFYTGMFISEVGEASVFGIEITQEKIDYSNNLFVKEFREVMDSPTVLQEIKTLYDGECPVIQFNNERLYYRDTNVIAPKVHPIEKHETKDLIIF